MSCQKRSHVQDSDSEDDELFSFQPFPASSSITKKIQSHDSINNNTSNTKSNNNNNNNNNNTCEESTTSNQNQNIEMKAIEKSNSLCVPFEITSPSELFFYTENKAIKKGKKRSRKLYYPCRTCHPDEGKFLNITKAYDQEKKCLVQYFDPKSITFRDVQIIPKKSLIPYHGLEKNDSELGVQLSWCEDTMNSYMDQLHQDLNKNKKNMDPVDIDVQILSVKLYLDRVLNTVQDRYLQQKKKQEETQLNALMKTSKGQVQESNELLCSSQSSTSAIISQSQEIGNPYEDSEEEDVDMLMNGSQRKKTQIRAGDVITYFAPHGQWGDKRFSRRAKIIHVRNRCDTFPLELDNGELLEKNVKIMLVEKIHRGEMKVFHEGSWLEMKDYSLKSGTLKGYEKTTGLSLVVEEQRNIIRQQIDDTKEKLQKEGFGDCSDLFKVM